MNFDDLRNGIASSTVAQLDEASTSRNFARGETLFTMGANVDVVFHVFEGQLKVSRSMSDGQAVTLAYMSSGAMPGLIACATKRVASCTTVAMTKVVVERWPALLIWRLLAEDAVFARNALSIASSYAEILADKVEDNVGSVERRIGRALLRLASDHGEWQDDDQARVAISRQGVADLVGSTLFTASRTLSDWERRGLVRSTRGHVVLTNPQGIVEIAQLAA